MKHYLVEGNSLPEVYNKSLVCLYEETEAKHYDNKGNVECSMTMVINEPFAEPRISRFFPGGTYDLERYRQEILDGIFDFEVEAGKWHYTYHERFDKWINGCIIPELTQDKNSRRAAISVRDNQADAGSENPACLQHIQFMIRDGKLDMYVLFRSNDAVRAAYMNMFALTELQKKVADMLDVPVGTYTHTANSYHCYAESVGTLTCYCYRIMMADSIHETAYYYKGDWDKQMKADRKEISKLVKDLRKQEGLG